MDVNCRPCWEGSDNGTWTDCVNGFGCHFLLPYLEAQDMIVAGWMGWLNVKESSTVTWLKALFHSATLNLINKECSRVDDDSLCVEEKINDYEWGCKGTCSNVWTKGGKVGLLVQNVQNYFWLHQKSAISYQLSRNDRMSSQFIFLW